MGFGPRKIGNVQISINGKYIFKCFSSNLLDIKYMHLCSVISFKISVGLKVFLLNVRFIDDMRFAYSAADLVVATAGAITCSELLVVGKPSILVCYKNFF